MTHRPFLALGRRLGMKEKEALERVKKLKEAGIIRRPRGQFQRRGSGLQLHSVRGKSIA